MMNTEARPRVSVFRKCADCGGEGIQHAPHCRQCGAEIPRTDPWWQTTAVTLPCGHDAEANLVEYRTCPNCGGAGQVEVFLSEAEWRALRLRRVLRGVFLLLLALIPAVFLVLAVLDREQQYVCGSWWYGLILVGVVAARLRGKGSGAL